MTLQVATEAARLIEQLLGLRAVLTRTDDSAVSLEMRAAAANQASGDLFISIHAGGAFTPTPRDFQTFFFEEPQGTSPDPTGATRRQNRPARGGRGQSAADLPWQVVQWEQAQAEFLESSPIFARLTRSLVSAIAVASRCVPAG